jgi:Domain of unknown function (DUF4129)
MNFELNRAAAPQRKTRPGRASAAIQRVAWLKTLLFLAVLILAAGFAAPPAMAQEAANGPSAVEEARDRVLGDGAYQTERPEPEELPDFDLPQIPEWLVKLVVWAMIAIAIGLVVFFLGGLAWDLLRGRSGFKRKHRQKVEGPTFVETPLATRRTAEERTLAEADKLAAEGRFSEAIHLLLLVALERLRRELGPRIAPAMTSREVLRLAPIPGEAAAPLTRMVALSEINHFGGRRAAAQDYGACRSDFLQFSGLEAQPA